MVLKLSQAIEQYNRYLRAIGRSPHTIADYNTTYRRLCDYFPNDPPIADLTTVDLTAFFNHLRTTKFTPGGIVPRSPKHLSPKTIQNIHTGLSSLWTWATERQFVPANIIRTIKIKRPAPPTITVFTQEQIQALLNACAYSAPWTTKPDSRHRVPRHIMFRDQAIVTFLLDTGIRASEACGLTLANLDLENRSAYIAATTAKNSKPRTIQFGRRAALALLDYLATRPDAIPHDLVFTTTNRHGRFTEEHMDRRHLYRHLHRLGDRAGVKDVTVHRFRHTFATEFLRHGGDIYILKELLGHASLEMVYRYVHFVQADLATAHRRASPADNWKLKLNK